MISEREIETFRGEGFLLIKNVFSSEEISRFSSLGQKHPNSENTSSSLLLIPDLAPLISDRRILSIAQRILGESVSFFFEANYVHYYISPGSRKKGHLHHDGKGAPDHLFNRLHQEFTSPYPVMRIGIYLQNTASQSGGLKLCPASHLQDTSTFKDTNLTFYDVPSEPGDVVLFLPETIALPVRTTSP